MISLVALLVLAAASANPVEETHHQVELREHYHHLSYIAAYPCHHPQPRAVPVHELLSPYQTRGKAYFPEVTVLHRCDTFAGCCEGPKRCQPLHAHSVHLPFKVTYLEEMGHHHKGEWEMEYYNFDNHTVCHCDHHQGLYEPLAHNHYEVHDKSHYTPHHEADHHDHPLSSHKPDHDHLDHHDDHRVERRPEQGSKKIDSLYITI